MNELSRELWKKLEPAQGPFTSWEFFDALKTSESIGPGAGWLPHFLLSSSQDGALLSFVKNHSYGEYIFDWGWAEAYERHGLDYYPKLTSMVPFTPVITPHFLMKSFDEKIASELLEKQRRFYLQQGLSSNHFLFITPEEVVFFREKGFMIRESLQYHFYNEGYSNFEDFLSRLKSKKARHIRLEREIPGVSITRITGDKLKPEHAARMYQFYLSTIDKKNAFDYLKESFFTRVFESMKDQILYIEASCENSPVAGALFFYDNQRLYGRYWGANTYVEHLHFELCYYQGIEFCLENNLKIFEAGAQGEHKIQRGFRPVRTYSAHEIKHPEFRRAIAQFIEEEKTQLTEIIAVLEKRLPYKHSP